MRKFLSFILLTICIFTASAEFRWGAQAGWNLSNYYWKQDLLKSDARSGFQAGVVGELMIPGIGFGIDLGALYDYRDATVNLGDHYVWSSDGYKNGSFQLHSIDVPLHLRFKWTRMDGVEHYIAPLAYLGPVFRFNVAQSNCKAIQHPAGSVALQFGLGAEIFEHWQISGSYIWGITYDIKTVKLDNMSARNSSWSVNVAYFF